MPIPDKVKERIKIERLILAARQENMASEAETIILNDMQESDLKRIREWIFKRSFEEIRKR